MARKKQSYSELIQEDSYCRNYNIEIWDSWDEDIKDPGYSYNSCSGVLKFIEEHYKYYIYCHHDKDIWTQEDYEEKKDYMDSHNIKVGDPKKPHYQIFVKFVNARWKSTVAKELNIPFNCLMKAKSEKGSILYTIHEKEIYKYHYDILEAKGTLVPKLFQLIGQNKSEEDKSDEVLDLILSKENWNLVDLVREINKRCLYSHFIRGFQMYYKVYESNNLGDLWYQKKKERGDLPWS